MAQLRLDENWFTVKAISPFTDDDMLDCSVHGAWCPNAYYEPDEIVEELAEFGRVSCPLCMAEIVGVN